LTEDLDEIYRRASALDPSRPSEAVRRKVLEHAAALAAAPRPAANRPRWRPAIFGTLAAAGLAGLLIMPRVFNPHPPAESADTTAPTKVPPVVATPPLAGAAPLAGAPPFTDAPSANSAPAPFPPPQAAARSRAIAPPADGETTAPQEEVQSLAEAKPRTTDTSRKGASRLDAAAQSEAAAQSGAAAQLGAAAQPGLIGGPAATSAQPASPQADPSATLRRAAESGDVRRLRVILGAPVPIDAPDEGGRTALILAASRGQAESVDMLLAHGADPNASDANGTTPLKAALAAGQPAIVASLRRAGAR
jgi:Ankyrin repeats (many copies)